MVTEIWSLAALWLGLALIAVLIASWFKIATAMAEIIVGIIAQFVIIKFISTISLGSDETWIKFLANVGAILLTFLAGAELDPAILKMKWKEALAVGMAGFILPFLGCAATAYYYLGWSQQASLLAGVALCTTSVAVIYAVMLESGLNTSTYGKTLLATCFVNDLGSVFALGFLFSPFTMKTAVFFAAIVVLFIILPRITAWLFNIYADKPAEMETKYLLFCMFAMGGLAAWASSEAVVPSYIIGMILAGSVGRNHALIRRLRTMTFGFLTPFYFIRAGSYVSVPALLAAPLILLVLLLAKMISKFFGVYPVALAYSGNKKESMYTTMLMSTGLTFGSIAALFGLTHGIIDQSKYSFLVATVIASAIVPTLIANKFFMPSHLLPKNKTDCST